MVPLTRDQHLLPRHKHISPDKVLLFLFLNDRLLGLLNVLLKLANLGVFCFNPKMQRFLKLI